ncbi:CAF17-like 4Fe-4S cluster assembly/insertion protein YgfZ [Chromobacterium violaceum]|uniref:CAF17-like 4Fe-4S cluster assembly/insertion protein YgfZ n=1 Tax=Chromobacterium violaceum TaxID=536 RepID=UPI001594263C|nr:folate-binding protein YgfZ [Chromobacterium violaceum]
MNVFWDEWLRQKGVVRNANGQAPLASHLKQIAALENGSVLAPLDNFALIRVEGEDAAAFLQGQLSNDIREVTTERAQYSTYSTAKGRMLASFLIWLRDGAYYLMVSADIAETVAKRLTMFVLRSKVKVVLDREWSLLGVSGIAIEQALHKHFPGAAGAEEMRVAFQSEGILLALPSGGYLLAERDGGGIGKDLAQMEDLEAALPEAWAWKDIQAGIAWVTQATQEQFVPQMANMELIGAVNFKKGCYPGQEIVARSQYLGKMKRRMFKVSFDAALPVGAKLYSPQLPDQSIGMLASECRVGENAYLGLAVAQSQTWEAGIFADEGHTIALRRLELPYPIESVTE